MLYVLDGQSGEAVTNITLIGSPYALSANGSVIHVISSNEDPSGIEGTIYTIFQYYNKIQFETSLIYDYLETMDIDYKKNELYVLGPENVILIFEISPFR